MKNVKLNKRDIKALRKAATEGVVGSLYTGEFEFDGPVFDTPTSIAHPVYTKLFHAGLLRRTQTPGRWIASAAGKRALPGGMKMSKTSTMRASKRKGGRKGGKC